MFKYHVTHSNDERELRAWRRFLEQGGVPIEQRPHPIFGPSLWTDSRENSLKAAVIKEQHFPKINVLTGEKIGTIRLPEGGE